MSLTFPPLNNQATDPITTANSNSLSLSLVTLTSFSTTFITAISSASNMVSINLAPAISVAVTGQDVNFDTRLNVMENVIFKLGSPLEKFISVNHPSSKSQGENDRAYLTDFSVNASQSETDQSSDDKSNCGPPPRKKPSRNAANIDICRTTKNIFDKDIGLPVSYAEHEDQ